MGPPALPFDRASCTLRVLDRLFWQFTTSEYDKTEDGRLLAGIALGEKSAALDPLRAVLSRLLDVE